MPSWDAATYLRFATERARPFADLLARVGADDPRFVVDMGCGPGTLTATLAQRWPGATVVGVDSSAEMVAEAGALGGIDVVQADVRDWTPDRPVDVLVTNAVLQWVPDRLDLLRSWVGWLAPGGWLALQVPGNVAAPSHALMREVAALPRFAGRLAGVPREAPVADALGYAEVLAGAGCTVDAWETTYVHVLDPAGEHGDDAVLAWLRGTALRPVLHALDGVPAEGDAFHAEHGARLRTAYPRRPWGTPLPFRRVFAVAQRP